MIKPKLKLCIEPHELIVFAMPISILANRCNRFISYKSIANYGRAVFEKCHDLGLDCVLGDMSIGAMQDQILTDLYKEFVYYTGNHPGIKLRDEFTLWDILSIYRGYYGFDRTYVDGLFSPHAINALLPKVFITPGLAESMRKEICGIHEIPNR